MAKEKNYTMIGITQENKQKLKILALHQGMTLYDFVNELVENLANID